MPCWRNKSTVSCGVLRSQGDEKLERGQNTAAYLSIGSTIGHRPVMSCLRKATSGHPLQLNYMLQPSALPCNALTFGAFGGHMSGPGPGACCARDGSARLTGDSAAARDGVGLSFGLHGLETSKQHAAAGCCGAHILQMRSRTNTRPSTQRPWLARLRSACGVPAPTSASPLPRSSRSRMLLLFSSL